MNDILKDLEVAYQMISAIAVSGDAVDLMSAARAKIRSVCAELSKQETDGGDSNGTET